MTANLNAELRKAAILIKTLDPKSAKLLLTQLNRNTANDVMQLAQHLDSVSSREKELVLSEFLQTVQVVTAGSNRQTNKAERLGSSMIQKPLFNLILLLILGTLPATARGNETHSDSIKTAVAKQSKSDFKLPERDKKAIEEQGFSLKQSLGDTGLKLAIVIGIFMIFVILLAKRKDRQTIPKEAIELLGRIPFSNKQSIQLIRFGKKLVLVEASAAGLKPISEITDPAEVDQMLQMIRPTVP